MSAQTVAAVPTLQSWMAWKQSKKKITVLTAYDYWSAKILASTSVDALLVGDSAAMIQMGHSSTLPASVSEMVEYARAVVRGAGAAKFIIGDLPFLSYRKGMDQAVEAAGAFLKAGAHAVKLEGAAGNLALVRHLVDSGIPVMGHLGLTPQSVHQLGGYRVQGRQPEAAEQVLRDALELEKAGCFSLVLECVPAELALRVTRELHIPTIGIGAGVETDGQVLVLHDLLGLNVGHRPKFVRTYMNGAELVASAVDRWAVDVRDLAYPSEKETYK